MRAQLIYAEGKRLLRFVNDQSLALVICRALDSHAACPDVLAEIIVRKNVSISHSPKNYFSPVLISSVIL